MRQIFILTFLGGFVLLFSISLAQSQQRDQLFPGARPFGMGETFVAIADDGNAAYWNPAGLPYLKREELNFMYSNLYGINIKNFYASYTRPILKNFAIGVDWLNYGIDDDELLFGRNYWNLSVGYILNKRISFGGNFKYIKTITELKGTDLWDASASGWGFDLGMLWNYRFKNLRFLKELRTGFMLHDATGANIRYDSGRKEKISSMNPRFGLCYKPVDRLSDNWLGIYDPIIAIDIDDRLHIGSEVWFLKDILPVALRGGIQKDFYNDEGLIWSGGFSIQKGMFRIDYSYTMPPVLPSTHRLSVALIWNYNPFKVEIADVNMKPIFAALKRHYDDNPIGEVVLKSDHHDSIKTKTKLEIDGYAQTPVDSSTITLSPNKVPKSIPVKIAFDDQLLAKKEHLSKLKGKIKVSYLFNNTWYFDRAQEDVAIDVFGSNLIEWKEPARVAAFVTKDDPRVATFSSSCQGLYHSSEYPREVTDAMSIYEALREFHVKYRYDPTPIPGFDRIRWPAEILLQQEAERGGDCEDLSVLYAALLENAGVYTALLKSEQHIFLIFNTRVPVTHRFLLPFPDNLILKAKGYIWLPIDPTNIERLSLLPFYEALQKGAAHFHNEKKDSTFQTIFINEEHQPGKYPAIAIAPIDGKVSDPPDFDIVKSMIVENISEIEKWNTDFYNLLETRKNKHAQSQLGCIYAGSSKLTLARYYFESALKLDSLYLPALNNIGNLYFLQHDYDTAHRYYQAVLVENELCIGTFFNLALLYLTATEEQVALRDVNNLEFELDRISEKLADHFLKYEDDPFVKIHGIMGLFKIESDYTTAGDKVKKDQKPSKTGSRIFKKYVNKLFDKLVEKSPKSKDKRAAAQTGIDYDIELRKMLYWEYEEDQ